MTQNLLSNTNDHDVLVERCIFDSNAAGDTSGSAAGGHHGGAINVKDGGNITINSSVFYDNQSMGYADNRNRRFFYKWI